MLKDMTLGQFFPGNSLLHRLDARTKILLSILYIVIVFFAKTIEAFFLLTLLTVTLVFISKISFRVLFKAMKPMVFVLCFLVIFHLLSHSEGKVIFSVWKLTVTWTGVFYAVFMSLRFLLLLCGTCLFLTYTTSPIVLSDAIERLLYPLTWIKIPVHDFAMMMTIALRFIPTLTEETDKIIHAQKARGADFESGNLIRRTKALIPVLIPLFVSAFRRAEDLAIAMECRCYRGGKGRTKMTVTHLHFSDYACFVFLLALGAGILFYQKMGYGFEVFL